MACPYPHSAPEPTIGLGGCRNDESQCGEEVSEIELQVTNAWVVRHCGLGMYIRVQGEELFHHCRMNNVQGVRVLLGQRFSPAAKLVARTSLSLFLLITCGIFAKIVSLPDGDNADSLFNLFFGLRFLVWIFGVFTGVSHFEPRLMATFKDEDNITPLHVAARFGCREVALLLIQHGANIEAIDLNGQTPIEEANSCGFKKLGSEMNRVYLGKRGITASSDCRSGLKLKER